MEATVKSETAGCGGDCVSEALLYRITVLVDFKSQTAGFEGSAGYRGAVVFDTVAQCP